MATTNTKNEALERELFNMKMRCHQYEVRLAEVNLHGATGETVQKQNSEYKERLVQLEEELETKIMQVENLTEICVKSKDAIVALQQSNVEQQSAIHELNETVSRSHEKERFLQNEHEMLAEKYNNACELFKTQESQLQQQIAKQEHDISRFQLRLGNLEQENKSQKRVIELNTLQISEQEGEIDSLKTVEKELTMQQDKVVELQSEIETLSESLKQANSTLAKRDTEVEQLKQEIQQIKDEAKHSSELAIALESEKLELETASIRRDLLGDNAKLEREVELVREQYAAKELECERLKVRSTKYMDREAELSRELARLRADLENTNEHERMVVQGAREELEMEMDSIRQKGNEELNTLREETRARIAEKDDLIFDLETMLRSVKQEMKEKLSYADNKNAEIKDELVRIKTKWKSSIAAKKKRSESPLVSKSKLGSSRVVVDKENPGSRQTSKFKKYTPSPVGSRAMHSGGKSRALRTLSAGTNTKTENKGINKSSMGKTKYIDVKSRVMSNTTNMSAGGRATSRLGNPALRKGLSTTSFR